MARHAPPVRLSCASPSVSGQSSADPGNAGSWPKDFPNRAGAYGISAYNTWMGTEPYRQWVFEQDLLIHQGRLLTTNQVNTFKSLIGDAYATYGNGCQTGQHTLKQAADQDSGSIDQKRLGTDVIQAHGMSSENASDSWYVFTPAGEALWGSNDLSDSRYVNPAYRVAPTDGGTTFSEAYHDEWFSRAAGGANLLQDAWSGVYYDSTDDEDAFPRPRIGSAGGPIYSGNPDYNADGSSGDSDDRYREGVVDDVANAKAEAASRGVPIWWVSSNGGRDRTAVDGPISSHPWNGLFDSRVGESAHNVIGAAPDSNGDYTFEFNNANNRFDLLMRGLLINATFCDQTSANAHAQLPDRGYALLDMRVYGTIGMALGDIRAIDADWQEFWYAVSMCTTHIMYAGLVNKQQPIVAPDVYYYRIGAPVGTPSLGSIADDSAITYTRRAADDTADGIWYFQEYANGYYYFNLAEPPDQSTWNDLSTTYTTTAMPSPPAGKVARRLDASTYVNPNTGFSPHDINPTKNDGSLVGSSITERAWRGGLVIWADS